MRVATFAAALGLALFTMDVGASDRPKPRTHTVTVEDMRFQPEALTVAPGDTIVWVNKDLVPHTVTSDAGSFDSKDLQAGQSWRYTARKTGDYPYFCTFHPAMKATFLVK